MGEGQSMDGLEGELLEAGPVSFPFPFLILPSFKYLLFLIGIQEYGMWEKGCAIREFTIEWRDCTINLSKGTRQG